MHAQMHLVPSTQALPTRLACLMSTRQSTKLRRGILVNRFGYTPSIPNWVHPRAANSTYSLASGLGPTLETLAIARLAPPHRHGSKKRRALVKQGGQNLLHPNSSLFPSSASSSVYFVAVIYWSCLFSEVPSPVCLSVIRSGRLHARQASWGTASTPQQLHRLSDRPWLWEPVLHT